IANSSMSETDIRCIATVPGHSRSLAVLTTGLVGGRIHNILSVYDDGRIRAVSAEDDYWPSSGLATITFAGDSSQLYHSRGGDLAIHNVDARGVTQPRVASGLL